MSESLYMGGYPFPVDPEDTSTPYDVDTTEEFVSKLAAQKYVRLTADVEVDHGSVADSDGLAGANSPDSPFNLDDGGSYTIDLNGKNLTIGTINNTGSNDLPSTCGIRLSNGSSLKISNGGLTLIEEGSDLVSGGIEVLSGSSLVLDGVVFYSNHSGIFVNQEASSFIAENSVITANGTYGITTNGAESDEGLLIDLSGTDVTASYNEGSAIIFNVGGTIKLNKCNVSGGYHGVVIRTGEAEITDCSIESRGEAKVNDDSQYLFNGGWFSGNGIAYGALVVGDTDIDNYNFDAKVTLNHTSVSMIRQEGSEKMARIYLASDGEHRTDLIMNSCDENYERELREGKSGHWYGDECYVNNGLLVE